MEEIHNNLPGAVKSWPKGDTEASITLYLLQKDIFKAFYEEANTQDWKTEA